MLKVRFTNGSESRIRLHFYGVCNDIDIDPKETREITLQQNSSAFLVEEIILKDSLFKATLGIILAAFVSIIIWLLNSLEKEPIENQFKFSTKFVLDGLSEETETEIVIRESSKRFMKFEAVLNETELESSPKFTEKELNDQIKEYNKTKYIVMIFPCLILCVLWISAIYFKNVIAIIIAVAVSLLIIFFYFRNEKRDKQAIEKIREYFN